MMSPHKKLVCCLIFCLVSIFNTASSAQGDIPAQSMEIRTFLKSYMGKPSWLLIVRDMDTGEIKPFLFDFTNNENTWVEVIYARHFRILESTLNFGPPPCAKILNFCHLQDGILTNKSFSIVLKGNLTPNRYTSVCHVMQYKNYNFPIVTPEETVSEETNSENQTAEATSQHAAPPNTAQTKQAQGKAQPANIASAAESLLTQAQSGGDLTQTLSKILP